MTRRRIFGLTVLLICTAVMPAMAKLPGIDDPKAYAEPQFRRDVLQFNRDTLGGAYARVGATNPKWDVEAQQFMDAMAIRFTNASASVRSAVPGAWTVDQFKEMGESLQDLGCNDALVQYCNGVVLEEAGQGLEALPLFRAAADGMMKGKYPPFRAVRAASRYAALARRLRAAVPDLAAFEAFANDRLVDVAASPECKGVGRRMIYNTMNAALNGMKLPDREAVIAKLQALPGADQWVVQTLAAEYYIAAAWQARGGGWANTVTEQGWIGFHENLKEAQAAIEVAYAAEPTYPEAPSLMITVAMGANDPALDEREWFDKAIAAQLDYGPAFTRYLSALMPRWGGSHRAMFAVAVECTEGDRFDTDLPFRFQESLATILSDEGVAFVASPYVYRHAAPFIDKFAERLGPWPAVAAYHRTFKFAMEMRQREYAEAKRTLTRMADKPDPQALERFDLQPVTAVGKCYAMNGSQGVLLADVERRLLARDRTGVLDDLKYAAAALAVEDPNDPGVFFLKGKVAELEFDAAFAAGGWVPIQPGKDLMGWNVVAGQWSVDDAGQLVGHCPYDPGRAGQWVNGPILRYNGRLGERFAVQGKFAGDMWWGGLLVAGAPPQRHAGAWFGPRNQTLEVGDVWKRQSPPITPDDDGHVLLVEVWDRTISVSVDGQKLVTDHAFAPEADMRLAISALYPKRGPALTVTGLQVKQLAEKP